MCYLTIFKGAIYLTVPRAKNNSVLNQSFRYILREALSRFVPQEVTVVGTGPGTSVASGGRTVAGSEPGMRVCLLAGTAIGTSGGPLVRGQVRDRALGFARWLALRRAHVVAGAYLQQHTMRDYILRQNSLT